MKFNYEVEIETISYIEAEAALGDSCTQVKNKKAYAGMLDGFNLAACEDQIHELIRKAIKAEPTGTIISGIQIDVRNRGGL